MTLNGVRRENRRLRSQLENWERKAERIWRALGGREGETLVQAAIRASKTDGRCPYCGATTP